jgi:hypothetical protein
MTIEESNIAEAIEEEGDEEAEERIEAFMADAAEIAMTMTKEEVEPFLVMVGYVMRGLAKS